MIFLQYCNNIITLLDVYDRPKEDILVFVSHGGKVATISHASLFCFDPGHLGGVQSGKIDENFFLELIRCESHVGEVTNTSVVLRKKQAPSLFVTQSSGFAKVVIGVVVVVVVVLVVALAGVDGQSLPRHS